MSIFKRSKPKKEVQLEEKKEHIVSGPASMVIKPNVLRKPLVSEKAMRLKSQNQFAFLVNLSANKKLVKDEVERRYGVKVENVNIIRKKGKAKQWRASRGHQSNLKKAIVTLIEGHKIEI